MKIGIGDWAYSNPNPSCILEENILLDFKINLIFTFLLTKIKIKKLYNEISNLF